ncbi:MAG: Flp pilus assembly protein CpaB [Erysipelothrix sp.]|nr:Flp pilus assembly protein CpaB [Erysipelothrix sp.]
MSNKKRSLMVVSLVLLILVNVGISTVIVRSLTKTEQVYVAKHVLVPRKPIEESDLQVVDVPRHTILSNIYTKKEDILGKVVAYHTSVFEGMFFFKDALDAPSASQDAPLLRLKENQIAVSMGVDVLTSLGNTLMAGQYVDVSCTYQIPKGATLVDTLFKDVRVLAIKDKYGVDMDDPKSQKVPHVVLLAIDHADVNHFHLALKKGKLDLIPILHGDQVQHEAIKNEASLLWGYFNE